MAVKGSKLTDEHRQKIAAALRGRRLSDQHRASLKANHKGMTGKKQSERFRQLMSHIHGGKAVTPEAREKMSAAKRGKPSPHKGKKRPQCSGPRHHNWKGGITAENCKIRNSPEYKEWRKLVFRRDKWTCVQCGFRSTGKVDGRSDIEADHIQPFADFPELRFDVSNGRTLCVACHKSATGASGLRKRGGRPKKETAPC